MLAGASCGMRVVHHYMIYSTHGAGSPIVRTVAASSPSKILKNYKLDKVWPTLFERF